MVLNKARLSLSRFWGGGQEICERQRPRRPPALPRPAPPHPPAPYVTLVLVEDLVVLAHRRQEYDGGDVLKAVDPLPPLGTLATHVHHPDHRATPAVTAAGALPPRGRGFTRLSLGYLKMTLERSKGYSMMPVVGTLTLRMSCRVGTYIGAVILSRSSR